MDNWTDAHNSKNLPALSRLYSDEVIFYAKELPKVTCLGIKSKRLQSKVHFHQEVITEPEFIAYSSGVVKASFVKRITSGSNTRDYDAYLLLKETDGQYLIVGESDLITDGAAGFTPDLGEELKQSRLSRPIKEKRSKSKIIEDRDLSIIIALVTIVLSAISYVVYRKLYKKRTPANATAKVVQEKQASYPEKVGYAFEQFIVDRFNRSFFTILEWRGDKISKGIYAKSSLNPDLEVRFKLGDVVKDFAIECKFRRGLPYNGFRLEKRQFDNYLDFMNSRDIPVYIALGLGGVPEKPKELYIIPLDSFDADGTIGYQSMLDYYNNPDAKFFYDTQTDKLRHYRKPNEVL